MVYSECFCSQKVVETHWLSAIIGYTQNVMFLVCFGWLKHVYPTAVKVARIMQLR